jgi:hypothetical protein
MAEVAAGEAVADRVADAAAIAARGAADLGGRGFGSGGEMNPEEGGRMLSLFISLGEEGGTKCPQH